MDRRFKHKIGRQLQNSLVKEKTYKLSASLKIIGRGSQGLNNATVRRAVDRELAGKEDIWFI